MLSKMVNMYLHCTGLEQHYTLDVGWTASLELAIYGTSSQIRTKAVLMLKNKIKGASSWDYGTYNIGDQSRQSLRCSHTWTIVDEGFDI